jgi:hypothetical protein
VFVGKLNGRTAEQAIRKIEESEDDFEEEI